MLDRRVLVSTIPTVHPNIDFTDITAEGRLFLNETAVNAVLEEMRTKGQSEHITTYYKIVDIAGKGYIAYTKNPLGKGAFGEVVIAQDIQTKEYFALKIAKIPNRETRKILDKEERILLMQRQATAVKKDLDAHQIIMKLAPGASLFHLVAERSLNLPAIRWLIMAKSVLDAVASCHASNLLHRDIKLENIIFDLVNHTATLVDFGFAIEANPLVGVIAQPMGSPGYVAPEILTQNLYSEKSEVYALGKVLAGIFGLLMPSGEYNVTDFLVLVGRDSNEYKNNQHLPNDKVRAAVYAYLEQMLSVEPNKRPTLNSARKFFSEMIQEHILLPSKINNVALLDVSEMLSSSTHLADYTKALLSFDAVYFIDSEEKREPRDYSNLNSALAKKGVNVSNILLRSHDVEQAMLAAKKMDNASNPAVNNYYYLSAGPLSSTVKNLKKEHIHTITIAPKKEKRDYENEIKKHLSKTPIDEKHYQIVKKSLEEELARLAMKYGKKSKVANDRMRAIRSTLEVFADKRAKLTYTALHANLDALQERMLAVGNISTVIRKFFGKKTISKSKQKISQLDQSIQEDIIGEFKRFNR